MTTRLMLSGTLLGLTLVASACGDASMPAAGATISTPPVLQLAPENVATAAARELVSGPLVSGQLWPAREATVRAQVGGSVVALSIDRGERVKAGSVIARIASRDLDVALESAKAGVRSAETSLAVSRSELLRTESLVKGGALAARDLDQAKTIVANAEAGLAAARSRETSVLQQLEDTVLRAPFDGIVNEKPANLGDVVAPGSPIVSIIDPSSLRLEGLVPSDQLSQTRPGAPVVFAIRGFPGQTFTGRIDRLSATADPVTRQVTIFVTVPNVKGQLIAGLFAEGRVESSRHTGVVIPFAAVDETGPTPWVTRLRDGKAERVVVELGPRQSDVELVEVTTGVAAGDVLVLGSAKGVSPGTPVKVLG